MRRGRTADSGIQEETAHWRCVEQDAGRHAAWEMGMWQYWASNIVPGGAPTARLLNPQALGVLED